MGAVNIWNAMEIAEGARDSLCSEIPSSSLSVDHSLSLPDMKPRLVELCKDLFKKWSSLDDSCFSVERVSGGITNLLLKISVTEENGNIVNMTVRLYGPNTEYVINRDRELLAIPYLSAAGFGAKLLGIFSNGMVQSFINARTLTPSDMRKPELAAEIAKQLRKFHQVEIPGSKEPQLWHDIFKFYGKASNLNFDDFEKQKNYSTISFAQIHNEIIELKELTRRFGAPVVYAHNDLLSGNLMLSDDEGIPVRMNNIISSGTIWILRDHKGYSSLPKSLNLLLQILLMKYLVRWIKLFNVSVQKDISHLTMRIVGSSCDIIHRPACLEETTNWPDFAKFCFIFQKIILDLVVSTFRKVNSMIAIDYVEEILL